MGAAKGGSVEPQPTPHLPSLRGRGDEGLLDILVIGGGIAGLSAAAALAEHATVVVLEAEEQIGFHSSGRSATMLHYALGDALIRALTLASRPFFDAPPEGFGEVPLGRRMAVLIHAREDELAELDAFARELAPFVALEQLDAKGVHTLCPLLRPDAVRGIADRDGIRLDPHAMLQALRSPIACARRRAWTGAGCACQPQS